MSAILTTLLGAIVPILPNAIKSIWQGKQERSDKAHEIELFKLQLQNSQAVKQLETDATTAKADSEAAALMAKEVSKMAEINATRAKIKTGIKWIDAGDAVIRLWLGVVASACLVWAIYQAWTLSAPIWKQSEIWEIIVLIICFFVGYLPSAYSQKKTFGGK